VRIVTLGCAKNAVDSEVIEGLLLGAGFRVVGGRRADAVVINTCGFIREAKEESIGEILSWAREKAEGRIGRLVVAGCLAGRYREELPRLLPEVDVFVGPGGIPDLPRLLAGPPGVSLAKPAEAACLPEEIYASRTGRPAGPAAYLKILEGCEHRCAYCTIPSIRGPLRSRDPEALLAEARRLVRRGAREINLVGQDIGSYGLDRGRRGALVPLVRSLCALPGVRRVRLLYVHPSRIDTPLVDLLAEGGKVCRYLDVPVQHADPEILRRMGRPYGPHEIAELVARLRERVPGIFLRTSVIAGFPGETDGRFERLRAFLKEVRWDYAGVFAYSREEGTRAFGMRPQVPQRVREERAGLLREEQARITAERLAGLAGRALDVLVEEVPVRGRAVGRHEGQAPEVDGVVLLSGRPGPPGRIVRAVVRGVRGVDLLADAPGGDGGAAR